MKFMHISDVHLGVKPDAGKAWSEKRAQDIWDSFAEMIEIAAEESPDFLLISGDLFHKQPLKRELKEVCGLFARIPQTKVLLMAGNHDYIQQNSFYRTCEWPENVCFFPREEVMCFDFPEQNTTVYGLSYWHREIRQALYDEVFPKNTDRINILLAHGGDKRHIPSIGCCGQAPQAASFHLHPGRPRTGRQTVGKRRRVSWQLPPCENVV